MVYEEFGQEDGKADGVTRDGHELGRIDDSAVIDLFEQRGQTIRPGETCGMQNMVAGDSRAFHQLREPTVETFSGADKRILPLGGLGGLVVQVPETMRPAPHRRPGGIQARRVQYARIRANRHQLFDNLIVSSKRRGVQYRPTAAKTRRVYIKPGALLRRPEQLTHNARIASDHAADQERQPWGGIRVLVLASRRREPGGPRQRASHVRGGARRPRLLERLVRSVQGLGRRLTQENNKEGDHFWDFGTRENRVYRAYSTVLNL